MAGHFARPRGWPAYPNWIGCTTLTPGVEGARRPAIPPTQSQQATHPPGVVVVRRTEPLVQEPLLGADRAPEEEQHRGREQREPPERGCQQRQPEVEREQADVQGVAGEAVRPLLDH